MEDSYKIVHFGEYCKTCEHYTKKEEEDPCDECLNEPANLYSHKPVNYSKKAGSKIKNEEGDDDDKKRSN